MKKLTLFLFALLFVLAFVGCKETTTTTTVPTGVATTTTTVTTASADQLAVDAVYDWLVLGDLSALTTSSARLIMATSRNGVTIAWNITHPQYIASNGVITQPEHSVGDVTVTLTATLTLNAVVRTKTFTATVLALPSPEDAEPIMNETFAAYTDGNIRIQTGLWAPVSGKSGTSEFFVVSSISGTTIPGGSKALSIKAFTETQIEGALVHDLDLVVIEADVYQTANGSPIYIQSSSSSPVVAFGLTGGGSETGSIYYRTDNGTEIKTAIALNTWYTIRFEVDLANKTVQLFYYDTEGNLIPCSPGPVAFLGITALTALFIRSGSSTNTVLNENPSYVTNIVVNRIEALPRPVDPIRLGTITGIEAVITLENGDAFTPATPIVKNYYGSQTQLSAGVDYSLTIDNPVEVAVDGSYTVTYTFTNLFDAEDVKVVTQTVNVFSPNQPNVISNAIATPAVALSHETDVSVSVMRAEGILHYAISAATLTAEEILSATSHGSVAVDATSVMIPGLVVLPGENVYFVVELNGFSNVFELVVTHQPLIMITTPQEFFDAVTATQSAQGNNYYLLANDLDFTGFSWPALTANTFYATLDGGGHVISNLTIAKIGAKGGIFTKLENATVKNLILDQIVASSDTTASALLCGEIYGHVTIDNVVVMNSSNIVSSTYGAILVGRLRSMAGGTSGTFTNIAIYNVTMETTGNYGGGLVAGMDTTTSAVFRDIYIDGFVVKEATSIIETGQMVGAIIGRIQGNTVIERVVAFGLDVQGRKNVGGLVGKSDEVGMTVLIKDVFLQGDIVWTDTASIHDNIVVGSIVDQMPTLENVWASGFANATNTGGLGVSAGYLVDLSVTQVESWWTTNLPAIVESDLWQFAGTAPILDQLKLQLRPSYEVTIIYNLTVDNDSLWVKEGEPFAFVAPEIGGYDFAGWFLDAELLTPLPEEYAITAAVTIYGKYEAVPARTVAFATGIEGLTVASQLVNYGATASLPTVPNTMIGGVLKQVVGWTLDGLDYDFGTPVVTDITLDAVWETVTYTVSFAGVLVEVEYGATVTPPAAPTHPMFSSITFAAWTLTGLDFNLATPITSNLTLAVRWTAPEWIEVTTLAQFHYMATVESTYAFRLMNDLDFTDYEWVATGAAFKGTFDGQNHTVANLTFTATTGYGGIFARLNGATITNLVLDGIHVTSAERAGILAGRLENATSTIANIVVKNSSVVGENSNGVGGLLALVSFNSSISNIAVIDTTVTSMGFKNVGGVVGRVDTATLTATDIYVSGVTVQCGLATGGDIAVGGFVGYVRDNALSIVNADRLVIVNTELKGLVAGAVLGYLRNPATASVANAYVQVTFTGAVSGGLIGRINNVADAIAETSIYGSLANAIAIATTQTLTNVAVPTDAAWWTTNLSTIPASALWTVGADGSAKLVIAG